jgi:hypothetical protein
MVLAELLARIDRAPARKGDPEPPKALRGRALARVTACGTWLVEGRVRFERGAYGHAVWGYGFSRNLKIDRYDHSCSQFAMLGLLSARAAGVAIPVEVWRDAARHWEVVQCADGGWDYIPKDLANPIGGKTSKTSMTGAGIMGRLVGLAAAGGGETAALADTDPAAMRALAFWAGKNPIPPSGHLAAGNDGVSVYYDLYAVERALMLAGKRTLGDRDWYREGALLLFRNQGLDGSWGGGEADTCFALLFLKKAYVPVATR